MVRGIPNGIILCDCNEMGVLEVKAPSSLQYSTLIEKSKVDSTFCFQEVEGKRSLKKDHQYFNQVQTQIHLTQASYCDFVVWGPGETHIEKILPDPDFDTHLSRNAELLAKVFTDPILATSHHQTI